MKKNETILGVMIAAVICLALSFVFWAGGDSNEMVIDIEAPTVQNIVETAPATTLPATTQVTTTVQASATTTQTPATSQGESTTETTDSPSANLTANVSASSAVSEKVNIETYAMDFPIIKKAVLYRNGVPEEIQPDDSRIIKMVNYIMRSVDEQSYAWVRGVIENSSIEGFYKPQTGMYLVLDLDSQNSVEYNRFDSALISYCNVIMIDSDSTSYHGDGNPYNYCFTPYFVEYDNTPDILSVCGF